VGEEQVMKTKSIVRTYIEKIRPRAQPELEWFQSQPNLSAAIKCAGLAINSDGKRYSHQRRISREILTCAENILSANLKAIKQCADFDELFDLIDVLFLYRTRLVTSGRLKRKTG
jgi:hypothetical protein